MHKEIRVFAPATVSNVACGFDVMGFAIDQPGDEVVVRLSKNSCVTISKITGDDGKLPLDPNKNTAGAPVIALLKHLGMNIGIEIEIHKKMALGSGLGSSAASAVASAYALNELLGTGLSNKELLPFAIEGEKIASGAVHADNVAPCLFGGFILIRGYNPIDIVEIPVPSNLFCTVIHPHLEINTKESRKLLPKDIPLSLAKTHWGNTAGLIAGLLKQDFDLISRSLIDVIVEPVRSPFIPGYNEVKLSAMEAGALGCNISGSGPAIFALSNSQDVANNIGKVMKEQLNNIKLSNTVFVSKINKQGPKIIDME
ncbi:MAG: homoserine kinase [Ignavibacteriales bacterium]|nr:homoserine kinase [Ignavibacteriales bacterium]